MGKDQNQVSKSCPNANEQCNAVRAKPLGSRTDCFIGDSQESSKWMRAELILEEVWLAGGRVFQTDRVAYAKMGTEKRLV